MTKSTGAGTSQHILDPFPMLLYARPHDSRPKLKVAMRVHKEQGPSPSDV